MPVMPVHLSGVKGLDKRADNVFYHPPVTFNKESNIVVYFGGDIQVSCIFILSLREIYPVVCVII